MKSYVGYIIQESRSRFELWVYNRNLLRTIARRQRKQFYKTVIIDNVKTHYYVHGYRVGKTPLLNNVQVQYSTFLSHNKHLKKLLCSAYLIFYQIKQKS